MVIGFSLNDALTRFGRDSMMVDNTLSVGRISSSSFVNWVTAGKKEAASSDVNLYRAPSDSGLFKERVRLRKLLAKQSLMT